ncbi:hypothetical protein HELRODRAFT_164327 [Helobdella robusta]|uniref:Endonuclease/exonuclease/phosphatase domain-containing protein n=1 Tax=Helobdella robusta TaxID=6412 RepID=T1EV93_HELRO|nr:hypothetical protein HELRODRAFT_164327 [Helobdella robusta]ESN94475.1 hypothetical protein HELRODRAFT_164327 [Helobdella robusta]
MQIASVVWTVDVVVSSVDFGVFVVKGISLLHLTGDVSEKNVIKIMRLGRKCETVVRPILIKSDCVLLRDSIMRNVYKFKSLKEFSHVGLNYDLTKDQRQEFKSFVDKAKVMEREENNQNFLFKVRGQLEDCKNTEKTSVNIKYFKNLEINDNNDKDCNIINRNLTLGLLNIRSLISKTDTICDLIHDGLDIFVLVETWHGSSNNISVKSSMPLGYSYVDYLRINDLHHGGLIIYFSNEFKFKKIDLPIFCSFEALAVKLFISNKDFVLLVLYRPGSVLVSNLFFEEFLCLLENITFFSLNIILLGDFNIHIEKQEDRHTVNLLEILEMFQLKTLIDNRLTNMEVLLI